MLDTPEDIIPSLSCCCGGERVGRSICLLGRHCLESCRLPTNFSTFISCSCTYKKTSLSCRHSLAISYFEYYGRYVPNKNKLWAVPENAPPPWTTLNWVLKNFRISKNDDRSFCRIPDLADSKYWGIPEFCKTLNDFRRILVKLHKILAKFIDFQSSSLSIFYMISNVVQEGGYFLE